MADMTDESLFTATGEPYGGPGFCQYAQPACPRPPKWKAGGMLFCGPCFTMAELAGRVSTLKEQHRRRTKEKAAQNRKVQPDPKAPAGTCGCGCGDKAQRTFLPGHDSKLKAKRRKVGLDPYTGSAQ